MATLFPFSPFVTLGPLAFGSRSRTCVYYKQNLPEATLVSEACVSRNERLVVMEQATITSGFDPDCAGSQFLMGNHTQSPWISDYQ